ncbi:MAG: hypothetical protein QOD75_1345 [Blastocatellia bacterium]|jgi:hypothetical protein|nr:hypothetical protein [Blastocatellia bacterium]
MLLSLLAALIVTAPPVVLQAAQTKSEPRRAASASERASVNRKKNEIEADVSRWTMSQRG